MKSMMYNSFGALTEQECGFPKIIHTATQNIKDKITSVIEIIPVTLADPFRIEFASHRFVLFFQ